jgi:acetyltransferase-like isoleucine patch superfamily enzyme
MTRRMPVGEGIMRDRGVRLGYPTDRSVEGASSLGAEARLRSGTVVYAGTRIGDRFQTGHNVVVREECVIGDDVSVWSNTVVDYGCVIGNGVKIHSNCYVAQYTEICDGAFLAPGVTIANDLYPGQEESAEVMSGPWIGPGAQLGVNVTVLPYVRIGAGTIVGSGAVVTRDLPDNVVAYGNPAVVHRKVEDLADIATRVAGNDSDVGNRFRLRDPAVEVPPPRSQPVS